ncbi:M48 family metalloprotease [Longimicrobium sp.]|uniref:M48 family metalloprotease n=1 Tax=Longimicrobium sp. TaxID=2029185 RepID=UPI002E343E73|nr:M48 family metalloprotease [Longimicrobium sp.]HEX6039320.1 M48 family metalloprotease [Longimicrobium sp.]
MRVHVRRLLPLLALALGACAVSMSPVTGRKRAYAYSWEQEVRLGRAVDRQITAQYGTYDDDALQDYVRRVGNDVLAVSHLRRDDALPEYRTAKFVFRVLDTEAVNAFALPGGYVYVTRGMLAHLENEAQLAVVLGHEIAHVAARHGSQNALEGGLMTAALLGAGLLGEELAGAGDEIGDVGAVAAQLMLFRYSRDDERESDRLGVEYAAMAGYRAAEGAAFFSGLERLQARAGRIPGFLSTHPDPGRRGETVAQMAADWVALGFDGERVEREAYLARIDGITLGQDPRQGYEMAGWFYHPAGGFRFPVPADWTVDRQGRQVVLRPRAGDGVRVELAARSRHPTADVAARVFVHENGLAGASSYRTNMNGFPGARVDGAMDSGGSSYQVTGYWLEHGGHVVRFAGISHSAYNAELQYGIGEMTRGFRAVSDPGLLDVAPVRLVVMTTERAQRFADVVDPRFIPAGMDLEALAILNGVSVDAVIPAGTVLKLPG